MLRKIENMFSRKSIFSAACGMVLSTGLIVILVLITMFLPSLFSPPVRNIVPLLIFIFSLLVAAPLIALRLNRLNDIKGILAWTFMGIGMEFIVFPVPLLFLIFKLPSSAGLVFGGVVMVSSVVFGLPAGLISIAIGIFLLKRHRL
jgi:hypothetical protein